jgi:Fe-S-cluster containining protein
MNYRSTKSLDSFLALLDEKEKENALGTLAREIQRLRELPAGAGRARHVHAALDEAQARFKAQRPDIMQQVRCGKGCAHCCRLWVGVTRDEAELLAERVRTGLARPDPARMELQSHWTSPFDYIGKPEAEASCVFLGDDGACTVYEDRPSLCRVVLVASDPELCKAGDEEAQVTSLLNPYAEVLASAALTVDAEDDEPPRFGRHLGTTVKDLLGRNGPARP